MTAKPAKAAPPPVTDFGEQIAELNREIRQRERLYPKWIEAGRIKPDTAERKLDLLRGLAARCEWLRDNLAWIKPAAERRREEAHALAQREAELEELKQHPAAAATLAEFPGARVDAVRPIGQRQEPA